MTPVEQTQSGSSIMMISAVGGLRNGVSWIRLQDMDATRCRPHKRSRCGWWHKDGRAGERSGNIGHESQL